MIRFDIFKDVTDQKQMVELSERYYIANQEVYEKYQRLLINAFGVGAMPPQMADPYLVEAESNHRQHFLEIDMLDGDKVAIFYKVYNMYGINGSYLWFKPISLNRDIENEQKVFQHLVDHDLIMRALIPNNLPFINYKGRNLRNDDYYCVVADRIKEIDRSKWRSAKGINKITKNYDIVMKVNDFDPAELHNLSYSWWKRYKKYNKKVDKYLDNMLRYPEDKRWVLTWHLNNQLIGFTIVTKHFPEIPIARIQHNRNILMTELDLNDKMLTENLANYMHYHTMKFIESEGYVYAFIGDASASGKYLAPYKARNFNLRIDNYDLAIEDYQELYK